MRGWAGRLAALVLAGAVGAACGPEAPPASPTPTPFAMPSPTTTTYELGATIWYAGLVLTFGTATAVLDERGGTVTVETTIANPGQDDRTLDVPVRIVAGGEAFEPTRDSVRPTIAAGQTASTTLNYEILGRGTVTDALLQVGDSGKHLGRIPFVAGGVAPVTLQPVSLTVSGTGNAADLRLTLRSGELRWDLPDWQDELPSDRAVLTVTYDVTYRGSEPGGFPFTVDNVALRLPDGSIVHVRSDGHSQSPDAVILRAGRTLRGLSSRFEIPAGVPGAYALVAQNGSARATIRIVLPG